MKVAGVYASAISVEPGPSVLDILARYGADAHLWMPGLGYVNGVQAGNWIDAAGTQAALVDSPVGRIYDSGGGSIAAVQATDINRPTLRIDANDRYAWQFNGSHERLLLQVPVFQMADDFCVIAGVSLASAGSGKCIFAQSNVYNHALPELMFNNSGQLGAYALGGGATINAFGGASNTGIGPIVATMTSQAQAVKVRRNGALVAGALLSGTYMPATVSALAAFPTLNPTEFLPGSLYPVIAIKGTVPDDDVIALEQFIASCSGITIG